MCHHQCHTLLPLLVFLSLHYPSQIRPHPPTVPFSVSTHHEALSLPTFLCLSFLHPLLSLSLLVSLCKQNYSSYPSSLNKPSRSLSILIFCCSARCVFKVQRPPREPHRRVCKGWNRKGLLRRTGKEEDRWIGFKGIQTHLNFRFLFPFNSLSVPSSFPSVPFYHHNKCHCNSSV